jgi:hypothetical protein
VCTSVLAASHMRVRRHSLFTELDLVREIPAPLSMLLTLFPALVLGLANSASAPLYDLIGLFNTEED